MRKWFSYRGTVLLYENQSIFVQKNRPSVRKSTDVTQAGTEGVGDEVDVEVWGRADDDHDVELDGHGQAVEADVSVGSVDQVVDFLGGDGPHGVVV